jgi:hypothetical protein
MDHVPRMAVDASTRQAEVRRLIGFLSTSRSEEQPCSLSDPRRGKAGLPLAADPLDLCLLHTAFNVVLKLRL